MKNFSKLINLLCFISIGISSCKAQNKNPFDINNKYSSINGYDYNNLLTYFSTKLENRPDTFKKYYYHNPGFLEQANKVQYNYKRHFPSCLSHLLGITMKLDLEILSNYKSINTYFYGDLLEDFIVGDTDLFNSEIDKWKSIVIKCSFQEIKDSVFNKGIAPTQNYLEYVKPYIQNSPKNRIKFISAFYKEIPCEILILFKTDLDTLFKTNTPEFIYKKRNKVKLNKISVFEAIEIWNKAIN
jgi:hypothetical protein